MNKENYIVTIDVGSANIRTVIAQIVDNQKPRIVGVGVVPGSGMRRGTVVEIEEVSRSIGKSVDMAELHAGIQVESAYVSIGGADLEFQEIKGVVAVGRADGEVSESDVERSIEASQAINISPNKEIIHIIPQKFKLDDQESVKDPVGMSGVRLEMRGIAVLGSSANIKNLTKCLQNNEIEIDGLVAVPIAAAQSALNKRQRELGSVLIELGAGVTSLVVYEEQEIIDIKIIPIGMSHVTNDIAIGLRTSVDTAEKVKLKYGSALPGEINKDDKINLSEIDEGEEGVVSRRHVAEIIEARMEEILFLVEKELKRIERSALLPAGAILSGGGAYVHGVVDLTKNILQLPAQIGFPAEMSGLVDKVDGPAFNVSLGMLLWALEDYEGGEKTNKNKKELNFHLKNDLAGKGVDAVKGWFKKFLP
jgi:cell division protein FtsA